MAKRTSKPTDLNQRMKAVIDEATEDAPDYPVQVIRFVTAGNHVVGAQNKSESNAT